MLHLVHYPPEQPPVGLFRQGIATIRRVTAVQVPRVVGRASAELRVGIARHPVEDAVTDIRTRMKTSKPSQNEHFQSMHPRIEVSTLVVGRRNEWGLVEIPPPGAANAPTNKPLVRAYVSPSLVKRGKRQLLPIFLLPPNRQTSLQNNSA